MPCPEPPGEARWAPLFSGPLSYFQAGAAPRQLSCLFPGPLLPRHRLLFLCLRSSHGRVLSSSLAASSSGGDRVSLPSPGLVSGAELCAQGRSLDAQRVNCLLLLPPAQGTRPRPPVWSSFAESLCPPPQGPYSGRCCSLSPPGYLLTASVAPQSATPCLCMPAGQPGGMVETGRIRRKEPPLCAERSRRLRHWAEAPRKETLSRGSC